MNAEKNPLNGAMMDVRRLKYISLLSLKDPCFLPLSFFLITSDGAKKCDSAHPFLIRSDHLFSFLIFGLIDEEWMVSLVTKSAL